MTSGPTREEIERLAYQLWIERGCPEGTAQEDWDRAERLLHFSADKEADGLVEARIPDSSLDKTSRCPEKDEARGVSDSSQSGSNVASNVAKSKGNGIAKPVARAKGPARPG